MSGDPVSSGETKSPDGRRARGEENRRKIVEAFSALIAKGETGPTAEQVAERAGVGLRTVFRHFDDMELLYREIAAFVERPIWPIVERPFAAHDWRGRLSELIGRRAEIYERIMPFKIAAMANAHRSRFLKRRQAWFARRQRELLIDVVPELAGMAPPLLQALDILLSFEAWAGLRRERRLDVRAAQAAVAAGVAALTREFEP